MNPNDDRSIFGVLVGLAALFVLWLWASGNGAKLWAVATSSNPTTSTTPSTTPAYEPGGGLNTLAPSTTPAYEPGGGVNTLAAIVSPYADAIAGNTYAGAQSGGVSVTPSVLTGGIFEP
jgi:hypothetical protein